MTATDAVLVNVGDSGHVVGWHGECDVGFEYVAYVWTAENGMNDIPL